MIFGTLEEAIKYVEINQIKDYHIYRTKDGSYIVEVYEF